jgi:nucleoside-diphosphate-sugar epimerase/uncharacterized membrane protein
MDQEGTDCDIAFDLTSDDSVASAFERLKRLHGKQIAAVIHLAAYFDFTGEASPLYDEVNVNGTRRILESLQPFDVQRFIYSGTMLVHRATTPGGLITEKTPIAPAWAYPQSKADTEKVIEEYADQLPCTLLHLAGLYDDEGGVPTLTQQIARTYERDLKSHLYAGDIEAGQAFIHRDDLLDLFQRVLEKRNELPRQCTILAGEEQVMSYRDLQNKLAQLLHGEDHWRTLVMPSSLAKLGAWAEEKSEPLVPDALDHGEKPFIRPFLIDLASDHYALDIERARLLLDWKPQHFIGDSLQNIVQALQRDPVGWYRKNGIRPPDWMVRAQDKVSSVDEFRARFERRYREAHARTIWAPLLNVALGAWLIFSTARLGYHSDAMIVSDVVSGALIIVLSMFSLSWRFPAARWATALAGLWVMSAPLVFWTPSSAVYLNGTLVGCLVVGFSVLVRPSPGVSPVAAMSGPTNPPGWQLPPSGWFQRLPIIILAFIGFFISSYMAAYQLGHIDAVWDPFFTGAIAQDTKNGTEEIITSEISKAWPVPDAGAGALVYLLEILTGIIGSTQRWRTMPWLVLLFGILIVPLGVVSITFIIIQPILLQTWCFLCLLAAAVMLIQIPYSLDELVATGDFLLRRRRQGHSALRAILFGDTDEGEHKPGDDDSFQAPPGTIVRKVLYGGISLAPGLLLCIAVGILLMTTRLLLGAAGAMADAHHLLGALIVTVSVTALAEVARILRFVNVLLATALYVTAFVLPADLLTMVATLAAATIVLVASLPRGPVYNTYGRWSRLVI